MIYVRVGSDVPAAMTAELQEQLCLRHCAENKIPVSHTVRAHCESEESLDVLRWLLRTMPPKTDALFALQFWLYSRQLKTLGQLCMCFQCRPTWVYSLDLVEPIYKVLPSIEPEDFLLTDERYQALIK